MSGETVGTRPLAIVRLMEVFFPEGVQGESSRVDLKINNRESVHVEYYSPHYNKTHQLMTFAINRDLQRIMEFDLSEKGLQQLWFRNFRISSPEGEDLVYPVRLQEGTGTSTSREGFSVFNIEESDLEKFQALGDVIAGWLDESMRERVIMGLPFQITSEV